ncbi:MAG: hypothetical protein AAF591_05675 [Verrucomicrobiota bacterium]
MSERSAVLVCALAAGWLVFGTLDARATASYLGEANATLEVMSISSMPAGFRITRDLFDSDPNFNIGETATMSGSGNFDAQASASATFSAVDPFSFIVGDSLSVAAMGSGFASPVGASMAESFSIPIIDLSIDNQSGIEVTVEFLLTYDLSLTVTADDPLTEQATGLVDVSVAVGGRTGVPLPDPFSDVLFGDTDLSDPPQMGMDTRTITFVLPAGETQSVQLSTAVSADAIVIPEPSALVTGGVGVIVLIGGRRRRRRCGMN